MNTRPYEELFGTLNQDWPSIRTNSRIHHRNVNGSRWKRLVAAQQSKSGGLNILRRNVVRNIDDVSVGIDRRDRSLHRANEIVLRAEIGKESDN